MILGGTPHFHRVSFTAFGERDLGLFPSASSWISRYPHVITESTDSRETRVRDVESVGLR